MNIESLQSRWKGWQIARICPLTCSFWSLILPLSCGERSFLTELRDCNNKWDLCNHSQILETPQISPVLYSLNIACHELSRLAGRKDLPNTLDRGTIPQTQIHEKNASWPGPADATAPGQEAFLTPYLTTVRTGTRGNSGFKSAKKYQVPSRKRRKALQITIKNLVQAFGSRMPQVRILSLGPFSLEKPPK